MPEAAGTQLLKQRPRDSVVGRQLSSHLVTARTPCLVYIDEAQDYFDANISNLLNQARTCTFAHGKWREGVELSD